MKSLSSIVLGKTLGPTKSSFKRQIVGCKSESSKRTRTSKELSFLSRGGAKTVHFDLENNQIYPLYPSEEDLKNSWIVEGDEFINIQTIHEKAYESQLESRDSGDMQADTQKVASEDIATIAPPWSAVDIEDTAAFDGAAALHIHSMKTFAPSGMSCSDSNARNVSTGSWFGAYSLFSLRKPFRNMHPAVQHIP